MKHKMIILVLIKNLLVTIFFSLVCSLSAEVPKMMNFQGRLTDTSGNPLTGYYNIIFKIYNVSTGGSPLWTETWNTASTQVYVNNGIFNVVLGSFTNITPNIFDGTRRWLGITVGADSEMLPRQEILSSAHSFISERTYGVIGTTITTNNIVDSAVTPAKLATGNYEHIRVGTATVSTSIPANGILPGSLLPTVIASSISANSIFSDQIVNNTITMNDLSANSVGAFHIINSSVTTEDIADGAVTSQKMKVTYAYKNGGMQNFNTTNTTPTFVDLSSIAITLNGNSVVLVGINSWTNTSSVNHACKWGIAVDSGGGWSYQDPPSVLHRSTNTYWCIY